MVDGEILASIHQGLLVLIGVESGDTEAKTKRMAERLVGYRVFVDNDGRMNRSVRDIDGGIILVPQFTLTAETDRGTRPSFSKGAAPDEGRQLFNALADETRVQHPDVQVGRFGAEMKVTLVNDGPVTFWLQL